MRLYTLNLFILILVGLYSCGQVNNSKKKDAMLFLSKIDNIYSQIDLPGNLFDAYNQKLAAEFVKTNRQPIIQQKIDTISFYFLIICKQWVEVKKVFNK